MIAWRMGWKIVRAALCCSVLHNTIVHNHVHTVMSSSYRCVFVFYWGQFISLKVNYFVFGVFPLCCCLVVSTSAVNCLETLV